MTYDFWDFEKEMRRRERLQKEAVLTLDTGAKPEWGKGTKGIGDAGIEEMKTAILDDWKVQKARDFAMTRAMRRAARSASREPPRIARNRRREEKRDREQRNIAQIQNEAKDWANYVKTRRDAANRVHREKVVDMVQSQKDRRKAALELAYTLEVEKEQKRREEANEEFDYLINVMQTDRHDRRARIHALKSLRRNDRSVTQMSYDTMMSEKKDSVEAGNKRIAQLLKTAERDRNEVLNFKKSVISQITTSLKEGIMRRQDVIRQRADMVALARERLRQEEAERKAKVEAAKQLAHEKAEALRLELQAHSPSRRAMTSLSMVATSVGGGSDEVGGGETSLPDIHKSPSGPSRMDRGHLKSITPGV